MRGDNGGVSRAVSGRHNVVPTEVGTHDKYREAQYCSVAVLQC